MRRRLLALCVVVAAGALLALAVARSSPVDRLHAFVRSRLIGLLGETLPGARVTIGGVGGSVGRTLVLRDVSIGIGGQRVLHVARVDVRYRLRALLRGTIELPRVRVQGVDARHV